MKSKESTSGEDTTHHAPKCERASVRERGGHRSLPVAPQMAGVAVTPTSSMSA